ncbi:unnamed protein product, partial [marine sediment metagenome]
LLIAKATNPLAITGLTTSKGFDWLRIIIPSLATNNTGNRKHGGKRLEDISELAPGPDFLSPSYMFGSKCTASDVNST